MNNYILCRWRDAITDPPPDGWHGRIDAGDIYVGSFGLWHDEPCWTDAVTGEIFFPEPGDQWLDITAIPGVPREVCSCPIFIPGSTDINNRIILSEVHHAEPYGQPPWMYCPWCGGTVWRAVTGITPTEVL